jgi:uncharacterized protein
MERRSQLMKPQFDSLGVDISNRCNLNCSYCFETGGESKDFPSVDALTLYEGIDFFLSRLVPSDTKYVHFHFGRREPLMNFPLLREVVNYIERKVSTFSFIPRFHLTTNGTYLNHEICSFLGAKAFELRISLDGFSEIQNKNRKYTNGSGTFEDVAYNLQLLKEEGIPFTINCVYSSENSFKEIYDFFNSIGCDRVDFFPLWISDAKAGKRFNTEYISKMEQEIENITKNLIEGYRNKDSIGKVPSKPIFKLTRIVQLEKYLKFFCGFDLSPFYCGAGRNYLGLSGRGEFFPCLKFINVSNQAIGNALEGPDQKILAKYLETCLPMVSEILPCKSCSIKDACKGLCYVDRLYHGTYFKSIVFYCIFQKAFFKAAKELYEEFKDTSPEVIMELAGLTDLLYSSEEYQKLLD